MPALSASDPVKPDLPENIRPATVGIRGGIMRSQYQETAEALYLTSGYVYDSAEAAERAFTGEDKRFVYSRYGNPTVEMFQERMRLLDGAEACYATATGMSAVFTALAALCGSGDRLVASRSLFGSCFVICNELLPRWGVETVFVDGSDLDQWREALSKPTTAVFFETPSNPMQEIVDVRQVSDMAHAAGATVVLDNVFATPILQRSFDLGADVTVYSGTKHIDGQGRVMGGAILGSEEFIGGPIKHLIRHTGPSLSPFNAWTLVKGLETMAMRVEKMSSNALRIGELLESSDAVKWVKYPFLPSHPQYDLARSQMSGGGSVITFELDAPDDGGKARAFGFLNRLRIFDISNNLGDAKSMTTHPATTTHRAMGPDGRAAIGITDGVVRL
ncbi:MAG: O-succinylhomoserine sulfhydrylase, partial [Tomitella sp.]|nr:O-succinylhomoserine sulfhydrylase [Tomitella sp.]